MLCHAVPGIYNLWCFGMCTMISLHYHIPPSTLYQLVSPCITLYHLIWRWWQTSCPSTSLSKQRGPREMGSIRIAFPIAKQWKSLKQKFSLFAFVRPVRPVRPSCETGGMVRAKLARKQVSSQVWIKQYQNIIYNIQWYSNIKCGPTHHCHFSGLEWFRIVRIISCFCTSITSKPIVIRSLVGSFQGWWNVRGRKNREDLQASLVFDELMNQAYVFVCFHLFICSCLFFCNQPFAARLIWASTRLDAAIGILPVVALQTPVIDQPSGRCTNRGS